MGSLTVHPDIRLLSWHVVGNPITVLSLLVLQPLSPHYKVSPSLSSWDPVPVVSICALLGLAALGSGRFSHGVHIFFVSPCSIKGSKFFIPPP